MQRVKRDTKAAQDQLKDMGQALDTGCRVFLTALGLLTKTIFGKLYLDADPDGAVTVAQADLADPFAAILDTAHGRTQHPKAGKPTAGGTGGLSARYGPWQPPHSTEGDSLPWGDHRPQQPAN